MQENNSENGLISGEATLLGQHIENLGIIIGKAEERKELSAIETAGIDIGEETGYNTALFL